jgi:hypothetical protein
MRIEAPRVLARSAHMKTPPALRAGGVAGLHLIV